MSENTTDALSREPAASGLSNSSADSTPSYILAANAIHHLRLFHESMRELGKYSKLNITLNNSPLVPTHSSEAISNESVSDRDRESNRTFSMQVSPVGISLSLPETNGLSLAPNPDQLASLRPILFNNPFLSDCLLSIKEQPRRYYCHRAYLSKESAYFSAMFCPAYSESEQREVEISLEHPEMFEEALRYMYKGSLSDKHVCASRWRGAIDSYFQLLWVANYLQMSTLLDRLIGLFEVTFADSPLFNSEYMTFTLFQSVILLCRHKMNPRGYTVGSRGDPHWLRSKYSHNRLSSPFNITKRMRRMMSRSSSSSISRSPDWSTRSHSNHTPLLRRSSTRSVSMGPNCYLPSPYESPSMESSILESSGGADIFEDNSDSSYSNSSILQTTFSYAENSSRNNSRLGTASDECKEVLEWVSAENITGELWDCDVVNVIKNFPGAVQKAVDPYGLLSKTKGKYHL